MDRLAGIGHLLFPVVDGIDDPDKPADQRPQWRCDHQRGRDQIRTAYDALGAGDRFKDCRLEGGHCAGMKVANAVAWFGRWFSDCDDHA